MVERLFLTVPWGSLQIVIVVFPDHTHLPFLLGKIGLQSPVSIGLERGKGVHALRDYFGPL